MSINLWSQSDAARILAVAQQAHAATASAGQVSPEYALGFSDALAAVAAGFGVRPDLSARPPVVVYELPPEQWRRADNSQIRR